MRLIDADAIVTRRSNGEYLPAAFRLGEEHVFIKVENAPTIEAEPVKHGYNTKQKDLGDSAFECSLCGYEDWDCMTCEHQHHNYCPNCGCKMDLEGEG